MNPHMVMQPCEVFDEKQPRLAEWHYIGLWMDRKRGAQMGNRGGRCAAAGGEKKLGHKT
jgi:hypothetical protein